VSWRTDEPLAPRARWRVGGPAARFAEVRTLDELRRRLAEAGDAPVWVLGGGANLLIADEGVQDPVVALKGEFERIELGDGWLRVGGGASIAAAVQTARRHARRGLAILEAVPGTMGGAFRMNAGTPEEGIWDRVRWVELVWPDGSVERIRPADARPSYRAVAVDERAIFVAGELHAPAGDPEEIGREHKERRREKVEAQVYDLPTCGSTWKNPPGTSAWECIDRVGLRGARQGDAQISTKHANFIVNLGRARARDIVELMVRTRERVYERLGILLEPEVRFWGFDEATLRALGAPLGAGPVRRGAS
jgi:UDP-N-acetylmuramate dehydrogenase